MPTITIHQPPTGTGATDVRSAPKLVDGLLHRQCRRCSSWYYDGWHLHHDPSRCTPRASAADPDNPRRTGGAEPAPQAPETARGADERRSVSPAALDALHEAATGVERQLNPPTEAEYSTDRLLDAAAELRDAVHDVLADARRG